MAPLPCTRPLRPGVPTSFRRGVSGDGRRWRRQRRVGRTGRDPGPGRSRRWWRLRFQRLPRAGWWLPRRERWGWRWRRGRRRLDSRQYRTARAQPFDGLLGSAAGMRGVVAFVAEPDAGAAEVLGCEQPVAEFVGDLLNAVLSRRVQAAGQQLDTAPSVEVPDYLLVLHSSPLVSVVLVRLGLHCLDGLLLAGEHGPGRDHITDGLGECDGALSAAAASNEARRPVTEMTQQGRMSARLEDQRHSPKPSSALV